MVISTCGSFCWALKRSCLRNSKCMSGQNLYFTTLKIRHYWIFPEPIAFEWQKRKSLGGKEGDVKLSSIFLHIGNETEGVFET